MQHTDDFDIPPFAQHATDVRLPADAGERKRVLNILAQRRHRRRRKERLASAEQILARASCQFHSLNEARGTSTELHHRPGIDPPISAILEPELNLPDLSWISHPFGSSSAVSETTAIDITEFLQDEAVVYTTFQDDYSLSMPDLDVLRAALDISKRLGQADRLFDLTAESVFRSNDCTALQTILPDNLKPTPAQLAFPHPPLLDVLPWPQVRTRLIILYNQPAEVWPRHPADGSCLTVVRLVYDMEEGGVRIRGAQPWSDDAWEIEQSFFKTWWFALDQSVVRSTNSKRIARGHPVLKMPAPGGAI